VISLILFVQFGIQQQLWQSLVMVRLELISNLSFKILISYFVQIKKGDIVPKTFFGILIGSFCLITGVLVTSLPKSIIVEIFTNFYNSLRARSKLPKQRRRIVPVEAIRTRK
jgi:ABC-type phosphate transport system permease subunit